MSSTPLNAHHFSMYVAGVMAACAVALALGAAWIWVADSAMNLRSSWNPYGTVTLEDYSVIVTGITSVMRKEEIAQHFENVRPLRGCRTLVCSH
jgi:hypothetical protein